MGFWGQIDVCVFDHLFMVKYSLNKFTNNVTLFFGEMASLKHLQKIIRFGS